MGAGVGVRRGQRLTIHCDNLTIEGDVQAQKGVMIGDDASGVKVHYFEALMQPVVDFYTKGDIDRVFVDPPTQKEAVTGMVSKLVNVFK